MAVPFTSGERPVASEPEVQQARLSKGMRAVIERQDAEARDERRRMDIWNQASLFNCWYMVT